MDESTARSRYPDSIGQAYLWALLPTLVLFLIAPAVGDAQVVTNITPSALPACPGSCGAGVTLVTPPLLGTTVTTITGGARPGNGPNLFHSFGQFNVGAGDVANFQNTQVNGAFPATSNILSRVTGGNPSQIYGTIQTTDFPGANLFLMNPAGVLFGPGAALDLGAVTGSAVRQPGSFYATTADYLKLVDAAGTSYFYANPATTSVLSVAPVVAFGFLGSNAASIAIQGGNLEVPDGQTLAFIGGPSVFTPDTGVTVPSGVTMTAGRLSAPNGLIYMETVTAPGEIPLPTLSGSPLGVPVTIPGSENAVIYLQSGELVMKGASLLTATTGPTSGEPIDIDVEVAGQFTMQNGSTLSSSTTGEGQAGAINISAFTLAMDASTITTQTFGLGSGGAVRIAADSLTLQNASGIITETLFGDGAGGGLFLNVRAVTLLGGPLGRSEIRSTNFNFGTDLDFDGVADVTGVGGNVTVQGRTQGAGSVADSVVLSGGSRIFSETDVSGVGGQISITAKSLDLSGHDTNGVASTINSSTFGNGLGGNVVLGVQQQLRLTGGATITSHTDSVDPLAGAGGMVTVQGLEGSGSKADSVFLSGSRSGIVSETFGSAPPGNIAVYAKTVNLTDGAVIQAGTPIDTGPAAGTVTIDANSVSISGGSVISSRAFAADAGQVKITANALTLDNGSIETKTSGGGRGGDVVLEVGSVSLLNGATINSSSTGTGAGAGNAGNVTITSSGSFTSNASTIATSAENARGGNIDVTAQSVALSNGAVMSASSSSPLLPDGGGNAGNITIQSGSTFVMNNSKVTTEASQASGGTIEINAPKLVQLVNSQVSTSVGGSVGVPGASDGGNINIDPQFVVLQNSQILAQAVAGAGGAITITATSAFIADPASIVDASSTLGINGPVFINSPLQNVGGRLTPLSQKFSSAAALLAQRCAARAADGKFSTFVVAGREGLPVEPGGFLASPSLTAELLGSSFSRRDRQTQFPAVTGLFQEYDARPIQLAMFGNACR